MTCTDLLEKPGALNTRTSRLSRIYNVGACSAAMTFGYFRSLGTAAPRWRSPLSAGPGHSPVDLSLTLACDARRVPAAVHGAGRMGSPAHLRSSRRGSPRPFSGLAYQIAVLSASERRQPSVVGGNIRLCRTARAASPRNRDGPGRRRHPDRARPGPRTSILRRMTRSNGRPRHRNHAPSA